jgi:cytochrome c
MVAVMDRLHRVTASAAPTVLAALGALLASACHDGHSPGIEYRVVPQGDGERGRLLLSRYQCGSCHAVPGAATSGRQVGPPLDGWGSRSYIAGRVPNTPATLQRWLQEPRSLVPQTTMPSVGVSSEDARDIAAYLFSLR